MNLIILKKKKILKLEFLFVKAMDALKKKSIAVELSLSNFKQKCRAILKWREKSSY